MSYMFNTHMVWNVGGAFGKVIVLMVMQIVIWNLDYAMAEVRKEVWSIGFKYGDGIDAWVD
jgi:hypothetical protein